MSSSAAFSYTACPVDSACSARTVVVEGSGLTVGRNIGRAGGAIAGIIAIVFGALGLTDKVPPWLLITLGALAVLGVLADYMFERRSGGGNTSRTSVRQNQKSGSYSTNLQAGRDMTLGGDHTDKGGR
jgi:hypothetical protein